MKRLLFLLPFLLGVFACQKEPVISNHKAIQEAKNGIVMILREATRDVEEDEITDAVKACKPQVDAKCLGLKPEKKADVIKQACEEMGHEEWIELLTDNSSSTV